ncbi:hypothetical protein N825_29600 [Skermanella stibiiresistens SB22]|uniref:Transposase n=1 Tax=Skermanella stibiiresistens SB22 TaxID=1385369 RepID=W9GXD2_9PROT|nr:hypothetical protein N825_29600 [Skermanella stibiiresistens SB22]
MPVGVHRDMPLEALGLLAGVVPAAAERLMGLKVQALTGASHGERSANRLAECNGYRDRDWAMGWRAPRYRVGLVEPRIPGPRKGSYFPGLLEPRRMAEKAPRR